MTDVRAALLVSMRTQKWMTTRTCVKRRVNVDFVHCPRYCPLTHPNVIMSRMYSLSLWMRATERRSRRVKKKEGQDKTSVKRTYQVRTCTPRQLHFHVISGYLRWYIVRRSRIRCRIVDATWNAQTRVSCVLDYSFFNEVRRFHTNRTRKAHIAKSKSTRAHAFALIRLLTSVRQEHWRERRIFLNEIMSIKTWKIRF